MKSARECVPYNEDSIVAHLLISFPGEDEAVRAYISGRIAEVKKNLNGRKMNETISVETLRQWGNGYRPRNIYKKT